jgi:hypothetical protein
MRAWGGKQRVSRKALTPAAPGSIDPETSGEPGQRPLKTKGLQGKFPERREVRKGPQSWLSVTWRTLRLCVNSEHVDTLTESHIGDLYGLYHNEWWTEGRSIKDVLRMLDATRILVGFVGKAYALCAGDKIGSSGGC